MAERPFHLAFPVRDIASTRAFYVTLLGCAEGRSTERWIDFNFFGHQLSAHVAPDELRAMAANAVDGKAVPVRHFGVVLTWDAWHALADRLRAAGTAFRIAPGIRFAGQPGEQATFFIDDPSGNALEFKAFRSDDAIWATT
jgi:extradiol dioxygenase family protein